MQELPRQQRWVPSTHLATAFLPGATVTPLSLQTAWPSQEPGHQHADLSLPQCPQSVRCLQGWDLVSVVSASGEEMGTVPREVVRTDPTASGGPGRSWGSRITISGDERDLDGPLLCSWQNTDLPYTGWDGRQQEKTLNFGIPPL